MYTSYLDSDHVTLQHETETNRVYKIFNFFSTRNMLDLDFLLNF